MLRPLLNDHGKCPPFGCRRWQSHKGGIVDSHPYITSHWQLPYDGDGSGDGDGDGDGDAYHEVAKQSVRPIWEIYKVTGR